MKNLSQPKVKVNEIDYYFIGAYFGLILLIIVGNIAAYYPHINALTIGVILPLGALIINITVSFMSYYFPAACVSDKVQRFFFYEFTGLAIVLCDGNIFSIYFSDHISESYLPSMYSLMLLSFLGPKKLITNRKIYQISSISLAVFAFILNFYGAQQHGLSIFQFLLLLLSIFFSSRSCPSKKIYFSKSVFVRYRDAQKSSSHPTVFGVIVDSIQSSSEKMMDLCNSCDPDLRFLVSESLNELTSAFTKLTTHTNIYEANIEDVAENMDNEDKKFIEENYVARVSSSYNESEAGNFLILSNSDTAYGMDQLTGILKQIGIEWNFDTFFVKDLTGNSPLKVCAEYMIRRYHIGGSITLNLNAINSFLVELESLYCPNPYHNNCHAADVMCSFLYLITSSEIIANMTSIELLATIIATVSHDVKHEAQNNRFLIMTKNKLAIKYNDISVLEMMHTSTVFTLMAKAKNNFLKENCHEITDWFRKIVIEMILATDMAKYFDQLGYFKAKYGNEHMTMENTGESRLDFFKILVKCADVGHAAKNIDLHEKWCELIMKEFFAQGDKEKELNLSVSMFCDRETTNVPKSQSGFIRNIVLPLYAAFNTVLFSNKIEEFCIKQLDSNIQYWDLKQNNKNQTEGFDSDRALLVVPNTVFNPRRGSMPLIFS